MRHYVTRSVGESHKIPTKTHQFVVVKTSYLIFQNIIQP